MGVFTPKPYRDKRSAKTRRTVLERDGLICQVCGDIGDQVHHIQPLCYGGEDSPLNAITLCDDCHRHAPDDWRHFVSYQRESLRNQKIALPIYLAHKKQYPQAACEPLQSLVDDFKISNWGVVRGYHGLWDLYEDGTKSLSDAAICFRHMNYQQSVAMGWMKSFAGESDSRVSRAASAISMIEEYLEELEPLLVLSKRGAIAA